MRRAVRRWFTATGPVVTGTPATQESVESESIWDSASVAPRPQHVWSAVRRRFEAVSEWITGGVVLDLGTGNGWLARALERAGAQAVATDASLDALAVARQQDTGRLTQASAEALPFPDSSFDAVATLEMLEHTEDPAAVLSECRRVLKPGGRLLVSVPNGTGLYALLVDRPLEALGAYPRAAALAARVLPGQYLKQRLDEHLEHDIRLHHEHAFRLREWEELFRRTGFELQFLRSTEVISPLAGVVMRLIAARSNERFLAVMRRVGRIDDWFVQKAPPQMASGWAFALRRR